MSLTSQYRKKTAVIISVQKISALKQSMRESTRIQLIENKYITLRNSPKKKLNKLNRIKSFDERKEDMSLLQEAKSNMPARTNTENLEQSILTLHTTNSNLRKIISQDKLKILGQKYIRKRVELREAPLDPKAGETSQKSEFTVIH